MLMYGSCSNLDLPMWRTLHVDHCVIFIFLKTYILAKYLSFIHSGSALLIKKNIFNLERYSCFRYQLI